MGQYKTKKRVSITIDKTIYERIKRMPREDFCLSAFVNEKLHEFFDKISAEGKYKKIPDFVKEDR